MICRTWSFVQPRGHKAPEASYLCLNVLGGFLCFVLCVLSRKLSENFKWKLNSLPYLWSWYHQAGWSMGSMTRVFVARSCGRSGPMEKRYSRQRCDNVSLPLDPRVAWFMNEWRLALRITRFIYCHRTNFQSKLRFWKNFIVAENCEVDNLEINLCSQHGEKMYF